MANIYHIKKGTEFWDERNARIVVISERHFDDYLCEVWEWDEDIGDFNDNGNDQVFTEQELLSMVNGFNHLVFEEA